MEAAARARLVEDHLDLARRAASTVYPRVKQHVEFEELVALATIGLAEAAERFDPNRGASFKTFAWYRAHGAIVDGLRRATQLPRRTWAKLLALRAATEYLEHRGERDVGAAQRGVPPAQAGDALAALQQAMSAIRTMYVTSLEAMRDGGFDPAASAPLPGDRLDLHRLSGRLRDAIASLPERERVLMTKHYWEGKTLLEAGAELGISKSWASRLHAQAVDRLRRIIDSES